ncbi:hypothetical protein Dda_5257 [Drechslerella dactyloides]|uniref:DUF7587 domain-containing protein n=1 Tax=Drechslerella dactyloides TaxID=74499 RepID=A0AAD6IVV3_DREDA|nr:hypothetical protein Dda_5257 [Drechslerella dactyloides]
MGKIESAFVPRDIESPAVMIDELCDEDIDISVEGAEISQGHLEGESSFLKPFSQSIASSQTLDLAHHGENDVANDDSGLGDTHAHDEIEDSFKLFVRELQDQVNGGGGPMEEPEFPADDSFAGQDIEQTQGETIPMDIDQTSQTDQIEAIDQKTPEAGVQFDGPTPMTPDILVQVEGQAPQTVDEIEYSEDSGYWSSRKRAKLTVKQYKDLKLKIRDNSGNDRLTFERISPNSKFYRTAFDKEKYSVRRVLFPSAQRKKSLFGGAVSPQRKEVADSDDGNTDNLEATTPEFDPLTPYRHVWTERDLFLLYVVKRWYGNGPAGIRNVLNRCFGINISSGAYSMQFNEYFVKRKEKNLKIFKEVFIETPFDDPDGKWTRTKEELQAAAEGAGVELLSRAEDDKDIMKAFDEVKKQQEVERMRSMLSAFVRKAPNSPTLAPEDLEDDEVEPRMLDTPSKIAKRSTFESKKRKFCTLSESSATPRYKNRCYALPKHILFRYWDDGSFGYNSNTLIRAGLFRDITQQVPEAPDMGSPEFDQHAANHINREKIATPMISTSNSLMWVLRKAALSRRCANATNPRIAVVDPAYLKKTFEVNDFISGLCKRQQMITAAHRYGGHYDILVWGEIPKEAIVNVMDYFELLRATSVPRHIHVNFRMDIVSRLNIRGVVFGMKFAVICAEQLSKALSDLADIVLGGTFENSIKERFIENAEVDWLLDQRQQNQNVSKYFLPSWSASDAETLLGLEPVSTDQ